MKYHIDTGLIIQKFQEDHECPLCAIQSIVEDQFLHEYLNDAVMEDSSRKTVNELGFCERHFLKLFERPNKLSVALQTQTRTDYILKNLSTVNNERSAKKQTKKIEALLSTCTVCSLTEKSMVRYYKTIAQMFVKEKEFMKMLMTSKGFCLKHYSKLLKYVSYAGFAKNEYASVLYNLEIKNIKRIKEDVSLYCDKHDYRNANKPLGSATTALPRMKEKLYGKDQ